MTQSKFWPVSVGILAIGILIFGVVRAKEPLRWSGWASGDAQILGGATHFARDGFKTHFFSNYWHPGFLGKVYGNESPVGYYTRYPHCGTFFYALIFRKFGESRALIQQLIVPFAAMALIFMYLTFSYFFSRRVAALGTLFIGTSVGYLQFLDCVNPYMTSEFMRFAVMYFFLLSERFRNNKLALGGWTFAVWILCFIETFSSLDYILFPQVFFWSFFILSRRKIPWTRLAILGTAPIFSFSLHFYRGHAALQHYGAGAAPAFLKFLGEKTLPFQHGIKSVLSFFTYFARTMDTYLTRDTFGFGFGILFLSVALIALLRRKESSDSEEGYQQMGFTLPRALALLAIPSFTWWIVFPNQSASFFNTPMHLYPIAGAVVGLALDACLTAFSGPLPMKTGAGFAILGILWSPALVTSKYLKEYPNRIDPMQRTYLTALSGKISGPDLWLLIRVCQNVRSATQYGDIILTSGVFGVDEPFMEYNADRRMDYIGGETPEHLNAKFSAIKNYRIEGAKKFKIFNPKLKIYALVQSGICSPLEEHLKHAYQGRDLNESGWMLYDLEAPRFALKQ